MAALGDENVGGLDVAMDDAFGVGGVEGVGDLDGERENRLGLHRPAADAVLEGQAVEKLHGDEGLLAVFSDFINRADVGMVESGRGAGLAAETFEGLRVLGKILGQEFEGDEAAEFGVFRLVNHAHAATAEFFDDAVVRDGLTDHFIRGLFAAVLSLRRYFQAQPSNFG